MTEPNPKVLFVDDFETVRHVFIECLDRLGIDRVSQAVDGDEALRLIRQAHSDGQPFDLVFADWNMPKMNGLELLMAVRKDPSLRDLPFIMVSANSDDRSVIDAVRAGVSDYIVKPFDAQKIARTIEKVVDRIRAAA